MDRTRTTTGATGVTAGTAAYVALAVADTALAVRSTRRSSGAPAARRVTKPLLMPTLAWTFARATRGVPDVPDAPGARGTPSTLRRATLLAQGLSGVGDVALLGHGDRAFLTGLGGFLAAHAAYVGGFASARPRAEPGRASARGARGAGAGAWGAAGLFVVAGPAMGWAAGRTSPRLRLPVVAYAGALCAMTAAASVMDTRDDPVARRTLVAGTALFLVSDSVLGAREFLDDGSDVHRRQVLDGLVMATYTSAQGLIAAGVARTVRATGPGHEAGTSRT